MEYVQKLLGKKSTQLEIIATRTTKVEHTRVCLLKNLFALVKITKKWHCKTLKPETTISGVKHNKLNRK